jgi:hypothetical protein
MKAILRSTLKLSPVTNSGIWLNRVHRISIPPSQSYRILYHLNLSHTATFSSCSSHNSSASTSTSSSCKTNSATSAPFTSAYSSPELLSRRNQLRDATATDRATTASQDRERRRLIRRTKFAGAGLLVCALCMIGTVWFGGIPNPVVDKAKTKPQASRDRARDRDRSGEGIMRLDGPTPISLPSQVAMSGGHAEHIPTGTSTVPSFPKIITLPSSSSSNPLAATTPLPTSQDYQLIGLGIRTVSFLAIQVYVVGIYIAVADIAKLQERLVRKLDPVATALVPSEREQLKQLLLDPERGEEAWEEVLRCGAGTNVGTTTAASTATTQPEGIRMAVRISPTRSTDYMHLRDGWVRGITSRVADQVKRARSAGRNSAPAAAAATTTTSTTTTTTATTTAAAEEEVELPFSDAAFGAAVNDFKAIWGGSGARKSAPKGSTLLLVRDGRGAMEVWFEDKQSQTQEGRQGEQDAKNRVVGGGGGGDSATRIRLGAVQDERISRLIWLGYLAGKNVSSEAARRSVVDGVMDFVERPVGTVAEQVV